MAKIKGWYYDKQLDSPLTSATLHANMWWDKNQGKFINWNLIDGDNGFGDNTNTCDEDKYETILGASEGACGYGLDPICTSILGEDFNIAISNTWSEFGGDPIGDMWNNFRGPLAGVIRPLREGLDTLLEKNKQARESGEDLGYVGGWISEKIDKVGGLLNKVRDKTDFDVVSFLNKALVSNGTRFSYYGGTGISFGNLGMKFTVFPQWKNGTFIEVPDQVEKLYPYFIGKLESFSEATTIAPDAPNADPSYAGMLKEIANKAFWFQSPPGGYLADLNSIDKIQRGTLKLKLGGFYEISNLVCSDIMVSYSKNMVKNPITNMLSPLFCDINITLRPSTKYSDIMLKKFVGGNMIARHSIHTIVEENLSNERIAIRNSVMKNNPTYIIDQDV